MCCVHIVWLFPWVVNGCIYVTSNTTNFTDWLNVLLLVHTVLYIYHCDVGFNVFRKDKV